MMTMMMIYRAAAGSGGPGVILDRLGMRKYPWGLILSFIAQNFENMKNRFLRKIDINSILTI